MRINLFLVTEAHRSKRQNSLAGFVHRFDVFFKALRRSGVPSLLFESMKTGIPPAEVCMKMLLM